MSQVLRSYCLDTPLYGDMPFTRQVTHIFTSGVLTSAQGQRGGANLRIAEDGVFKVVEWFPMG